MAYIGVPDDCEEAIRAATWEKYVYLGSHAAPGSVIRQAVSAPAPTK